MNRKLAGLLGVLVLGGCLGVAAGLNTTDMLNSGSVELQGFGKCKVSGVAIVNVTYKEAVYTVYVATDTHKAIIVLRDADGNMTAALFGYIEKQDDKSVFVKRFEATREKVLAKYPNPCVYFDEIEAQA